MPQAAPGLHQAHHRGKEVQEAPEKMDRRGFLRKLGMKFHEEPIKTGTIGGMTIGGTKYAISNLSGYLNKRKIAKLKDEKTTDQQKKEVIINALEKMEKDYEKLGQENEDLREQIYELREKLGLPNKEDETGGLEDTLNKPDNPLPLAMIFSGLICIV